MPNPGFVSIGGNAELTIRQMLEQRAAQQQAAIVAQAKAAADAEKLAYDRDQDAQDLMLRAGAQDIQRAEQQRLRETASAAEERRLREQSDAANTRGMRLRTADALRQPGILDNTGAMRALAADMYGETGQVPGILSRAFEAPDAATPGSFEEYVGLPPEQQRVREGQRKSFYQADDRPRAAGGGAARPTLTERQMPLGVQEYLATFPTKRYGKQNDQTYTIEMAFQEVMRPDIWNKLKAAHPQLSAERVRRTLETMYGNEDFAPPDDEKEDDGGGGPAPAAPGGRTATAAEVAAAAQRMGMTPAEMQRQLEARGVTVR